MKNHLRPDLIEWVNRNSIIVDAQPIQLLEMKNWCDENIGEMRPCHPLREAQLGWVDFFDGEWCYMRVDPQEYQEYPKCSEYKFNFWFRNASDKTRFTLIFG